MNYFGGRNLGLRPWSFSMGTKIFANFVLFVRGVFAIRIGDLPLLSGFLLPRANMELLIDVWRHEHSVYVRSYICAIVSA